MSANPSKEHRSNRFGARSDVGNRSFSFFSSVYITLDCQQLDPCLFCKVSGRYIRRRKASVRAFLGDQLRLSDESVNHFSLWHNTNDFTLDEQMPLAAAGRKTQAPSESSCSSCPGDQPA